MMMKKQIHYQRMLKDSKQEDESLDPELFNETFIKLSKKSGDKYKFMMRAGSSMKPALYNLCNTVWRTEVLPSSWSESTLIQLYKGSGSLTEFQNQRFIHTKEEIPKLFGNIVMTAVKDKLIGNMSKFQIGAKPGHRASEHLFVIKSVISLYSKYDKAVIISTWDIQKFFDKENLYDVMNEISKNDVHGKLYRLLYLMNKNTRIRVKTPVGVTEFRNTGEGLGQGSTEGAIASAVNLDNGVQDFFSDSEDEVMYHGLKILPLIFQDDVAQLSLTVAAAQAGNLKMQCVAETKVLDFHPKKSCYIIVGPKKRRQEIINEIASQPLMLYDQNMMYEHSAKYLGDWLSQNGLADSVALTVEKRKGLVCKSIYDIRSVIDDCRSHTVGGLSAGLDIWEIAVIPMLLHNAETWQSVSPKTIETLEKMQVKFLRCLLGVGTGCPIPLLYSETGVLLMEFRILQKKLTFIHHVFNSGNNSLAREVMALQAELDLPGIYQECKDFLIRFDLDDLSNFSKDQFKRKVAKLLEN